MFERDYPNTCISCGFASWIDRHKPPGDVELLTAAQRADGSVGEDHTLWCFRQQAPLEEQARATMRRELAEAADIPPAWESRRKAISGVLVHERSECPEWEVYEDHMPPSWHLQRRDTRRLEEQRRLWQADLEDNRKAWEVEFKTTLEESRRAFEQDQAADAKAFAARLADAEMVRENRDREIGYFLTGTAIFLATAGWFLQLAIAKHWFGL